MLLTDHSDVIKLRPSSFFFRLASNAFSDIGSSVGLKKKKAKKRVIRIISSEKWFNYISATSLLFLFLKMLENAKDLGRWDDTKRRKEEDGLNAYG